MLKFWIGTISGNGRHKTKYRMVFMANGKLAKLGGSVKRAVGIEGNTGETLKPMITYASSRIGTEGAIRVANAHYTGYLTYLVGLSAGQTTLLAFIRSIWDAIIDPFIAVFVDRTRSRLGKHRIYIVLAAVPFALAYILRWDPLAIVRGSENINSILAYYLLTGMLLSTCESIHSIAYDAMLPAIAPGYFQRTQFQAVLFIFNALGQGPAQVLSTAIVGIRSTQEYSWALYPKILKLVIAVNVVLAVTIIYSGLATKEPSSKHARFEPLRMLTFFQELRDVFRNKAFRSYFFSYLFRLFALNFTNTNTDMHFLRYVAQRWELRSQLQLADGFEPFAFPVNYMLTKKYGKQKCASITTPLLYAYYGLALVIKPRYGLPGLGTFLLYLRAALRALGESGLGFTQSNILPDVTEVDEMITGRRREATIISFRSFLNTMSSGFMTSVVGVFLEWFGVTDETAMRPLFKARASSIHPRMDRVFGLKLLTGAVPAVFLFFCMRQLKKYKMTEDEHKLLRRAIQDKRENGAAGVTEEEKKTLEGLAGQAWEDMWIGRAERKETSPLLEG